MKRTLVLFALIMLVSTAFAQLKKDRTSAYNYWMKKDFAKAKEFIDKAILYPEAATDAKVWFYRGNIYLDLHLLSVSKTKIEIGMTKIQVYGILGEPKSISKTTTSQGVNELLFYTDINSTININEKGVVDYINEIPQENSSKSLIVPNAIEIAYESYLKAKSIDTKGEFSTDIFSRLSIIGGEFFNEGISNFGKEQFETALTYFQKSTEISINKNVIDTLANYGVALCLEKKALSDTSYLDKAIEKYQYLVDIQMKEVSVYTSLAMLYKDKGNIDKASEVLAIGKSYFPGNTDLIITEANIYISTNNHARAISSLMAAKEKEPKNVSVLYAVGVTYDLMKNDVNLPEADRAKYLEEAIKAYKETLDVDGNYFDALFNLGVMYFNKGGEIINEANKLPISETVKYDKMLAEGNNYLNLALPYLEKCETLQPNDKSTLVSLKEIYTRLKMDDKRAGINEKLSNL